MIELRQWQSFQLKPNIFDVEQRHIERLRPRWFKSTGQIALGIQIEIGRPMAGARISKFVGGET